MREGRVLLVDDHNLVRAGLRKLLDRLPGIEVVGEADNGASALQLVRQGAPDVVITDIGMKGGGGIELARALRSEFPAVRVVILSMLSGEDYVEQALACGIAAYLLKDSAMAELQVALEAVLNGHMYLSPAVSGMVVQGYVRANAERADSLTPRQKDVLARIARGQSAKEIAFDLGLSVKTVESHRQQLMERLGIRDVAGLVRYAIRNGVL